MRCAELAKTVRTALRVTVKLGFAAIVTARWNRANKAASASANRK